MWKVANMVDTPQLPLYPGYKSPKPKRRWYQFSLLTLMVVTTVATVAFGGWVQYRRQRAKENRERVAAVEESAAAIEKIRRKFEVVYKEQRPQTWLERQFDDPGSADDPVRVLHLKYTGGESGRGYFTDFTDTTIEHMMRLWNSIGPKPRLNRDQFKTLYFPELKLWGTSVTDTSLKNVKELKGLRGLKLYRTKVTDAGLEHLKEMNNLTYLYIYHAIVTDTGLEHLKGLTKLEYLHIEYAMVTDEGVNRLQQALPNCRIVRDTPFQTR